MMCIEDVVVWDKQSGDQLKRLTGHKGDLVGVALNPGNLWEFVSFDRDGSFIVQVDRVLFDLFRWHTDTPLLKKGMDMADIAKHMIQIKKEAC
jgi:hypothetical protein